MFGPRSSGLDELLHRPRPSAWQEFWRAPCVFLAAKLYSWRRILPAAAPRPADAVSVVCVSDTHNSQPPLPEGDVLIHAGDLTQSGSLDELRAALAWLRRQPFRHKVVVAGNHDALLDASRDAPGAGGSSDRARLDWGDIIYLHDSAADISCVNGRRLRVYGSPKSPRHGNWAFQYPRSEDVWGATVPDNVDILVTHAPPCGHLDLVNLGCAHLLRELWRVHPRLHVFGHVHEGYGTEWVSFDGLQAAYESVVLAKGGLGNLFRVCRELAASFLGASQEARALLVNPSMVGGLRDSVKRRAIKIVV